MAQPIIWGTLSCTQGTKLTRLGISNTNHPQGYRQNQLTMQTTAVITTMYTGRYQVLRHIG